MSDAPAQRRINWSAHANVALGLGLLAAYNLVAYYIPDSHATHVGLVALGLGFAIGLAVMYLPARFARRDLQKTLEERKDELDRHGQAMVDKVTEVRRELHAAEAEDFVLKLILVERDGTLHMVMDADFSRCTPAGIVTMLYGTAAKISRSIPQYHAN